MKKSIIAILIVLAMTAMALAACSSNAPATPSPEAPAPTAAVPEAPAPTEEAPAPEPVEPEKDIVFEAAYGYFKNFPSDSNMLKSDALFSLIEAEEDMLILDIRRAEDYAAGHLSGAVNLSFFDMSISDNIEKLPNDKPIMVYCYSGQTASQVTALLNIAGKMAKNIQSGFNGGISKAENVDSFLETVENALPEESYPVAPELKEALNKYFADKMAKDGTPFASFNVGPDSVKTIVDEENDDYLILSIRRADDYAAGHIQGAVNIPFGQGMEDALSQLPKDKQIIVYCYSGQTSSQTMATLRLMGYEAFSMTGGMGNAEAKTGWLGAGYEVVAD